MKAFKLFIVLLVFFIVVGYHCLNAKEATFTKKYPTRDFVQLGFNYKNFIYFDDKIWAVSNEGNLIIWNLKNDRLTKKNYSLTGLTSINLLSKNDIYMGSKDGEIFKFDKASGQIKKEDGGINGIVYAIFMGDADNIYAVTEKGVAEVKTKKVYTPQRSLNSQINDHYQNWFLGEPSSTFSDSKEPTHKLKIWGTEPLNKK